MTSETETLLSSILAAQLDGNDLAARQIGALIVVAFLLCWIATWTIRGRI